VTTTPVCLLFHPAQGAAPPIPQSIDTPRLGFFKKEKIMNQSITKFNTSSKPLHASRVPKNPPPKKEKRKKKKKKKRKRTSSSGFTVFFSLFFFNFFGCPP
jgi:hypothetical protein